MSLMSWSQKKKEQDRAEYEIRAIGGDSDTLKDMDWMLKHPGEGKTLAEVRQRRMAEALEVEQKAAEEKRLANEARAAAHEAEILKYAVEHLNKNIVITIQGRRLSKASSFDDLKCDVCGEPLHKARGMAIEASEHHRRSPTYGDIHPFLKVDHQVCKSCNLQNKIMVQVIH